MAEIALAILGLVTSLLSAQGLYCLRAHYHYPKGWLRHGGPQEALVSPPQSEEAGNAD